MPFWFLKIYLQIKKYRKWKSYHSYLDWAFKYQLLFQILNFLYHVNQKMKFLKKRWRYGGFKICLMHFECPGVKGRSWIEFFNLPWEGFKIDILLKNNSRWYVGEALTSFFYGLIPAVDISNSLISAILSFENLLTK